MTESKTSLTLGDREIILLGTAHISKESVTEVQQAIREESPDRVCIEIDESRYKAIAGGEWKNLKITRILREKKGFLLLANLVLASFQKRLGLDLGIKPGAEMVAAIKTADELRIPFSLIDREIQITLKRAWAKTGFWGKNKMLAVMLGSLFTREKLSEDEIEKLKNKDVLQGMLEEISEFLPSIKEVLIDERDEYLAAKIFEAEGKKVLAVVGAGHIPGILKRLQMLQDGKASPDVSALNEIPQKKFISKSLPWILPVVIIGAIIAGFIVRGSDVTLNYTMKWI